MLENMEQRELRQTLIDIRVKQEQRYIQVFFTLIIITLFQNKFPAIN